MTCVATWLVTDCGETVFAERRVQKRITVVIGGNAAQGSRRDVGSVTLDLGVYSANEVVALDLFTSIPQMVFGWYGPGLCGIPDDTDSAQSRLENL